MLDDFDLLSALKHSLTHGFERNIHKLRTIEGIFEAPAQEGGQRIVLDAHALCTHARATEGLADALVVVIAVPVGIHDVVTVARAPRHTRIDIGGDRARALLRHDEGVVPTEVREEKVGVVLDAVETREHNSVEVLCGHDVPKTADAAFHVSVGEGELLLFAILDGLEGFEFGYGGSGFLSHGVLLNSREVSRIGTQRCVCAIARMRCVEHRAIDAAGARLLCSRAPGLSRHENLSRVALVATLLHYQYARLCCECHRKGKTLMSKGGSEPLACLLDRRLRELTQRVNNAPVA